MKLIKFVGVNGDVYANPEKVTHVTPMKNNVNECFIHFDNENCVKIIEPLVDVTIKLQSFN